MKQYKKEKGGLFLFLVMLTGCLGSVGVLWWAINWIISNSTF
jgi:hypothetical protein